eukprot:5948440-Amphidinium_carterae.1
MAGVSRLDKAVVAQRWKFALLGGAREGKADFKSLEAYGENLESYMLLHAVLAPCLFRPTKFPKGVVSSHIR